MLKLQIKMGKSRPYISNSIRLLSLPEQIISEVENGKLSQAHARSLVGLNRGTTRLFLFNELLRKTFL